MIELYMLVTLYGQFAVSATTSGTLIGPNQMSKMGPMDSETCQRAADALNAQSPNFHANCERLPIIYQAR